MTDRQVHFACLYIAILILFTDAMRPTAQSPLPLDRAISQARDCRPRCTRAMTRQQGEWLRVARVMGIALAPDVLQSAFERLDCTGPLDKRSRAAALRVL
jgi:hypothetical protein